MLELSIGKKSHALFALFTAIVLVTLATLGAATAAGQAYAAQDAGAQADASALLAAQNADAETIAAAEFSPEASAFIVYANRARNGKVGVKAGATYKLAPKSSAKSARITCKSSKPKVAKVSNKGVVKALKTGKTTITIKAKKGKKSATTKVVVTVLKASKFKNVTKVKAATEHDMLAPGGTTYFSKVTVKPAKASNKNYTFKSTNKKVLTVSDSGLITAKKAGTAKILVTSCSNPKKKAAVKIKVVSVKGVKWKSGLGSYSWTEIKKIANAIAAAPSDAAGLAIAEGYALLDKKGKLDPEGDIDKGIDIPMADGEHGGNVRIIGFRHDLKSGGGKAGITFMAPSISHGINPAVPNDWGGEIISPTAGGWKASAIRSFLNGDYLNAFPAEVRNSIVAVQKEANNVGCDEDVDYMEKRSVADISTTTDKMWLLAPAEVFTKFTSFSDWTNQPFSSTDVAMFKAEGSQYKLFKDNGVTSCTGAYEVVPDTYCRTPQPGSGNQWCHMDGPAPWYTKSTGLYGLFAASTELENFHPCFCF